MEPPPLFESEMVRNEKVKVFRSIRPHSFFTQLTPKSAISFDTSMWGVNDPEWTIQNYRVGSLYRLNFYRPWLFIEIAPEVTWPEDVSGNRKSTYVLMSTLEIQFGK